MRHFLTTCFLIYLLCLLLPASVLGSEGEPIQIWATKPFYHWIGSVPADGTQVEVTVNGKTLESSSLARTTHKESLHLRISLNYGEESNRITIKSGEEVLFDADVLYAPSYEIELVPEEYEHIPFHTEENEKSCLPCHRLQATEADKNPAEPKASVCYSCHWYQFSKTKKQHTAAGIKWQCLKCHQAEPMETDLWPDAPLRFIIEEGEAVAPLCYGCHTKKQKEIASHEYHHGPIGMDGCTICHDPHGTDLDKFMHKDINTLCIECHEFQEVLEQPVVHKVLKEKGCVVCHDAHGSDYPAQLIAKTNATCYKCHRRIQSLKDNHPISGHPVSGPKDPHYPSNAFTCVSCHLPHSGEYDYLLPEEEMMMVCIYCHPMGT